MAADLAPVPAGRFEMGRHVGSGSAAERPVHSVYLSAFDIDVHEVTNQKYADFLNRGYAEGWIHVFDGVVYSAEGDSAEEGGDRQDAREGARSLHAVLHALLAADGTVLAPRASRHDQHRYPRFAQYRFYSSTDRFS